MHEWFDPGPLFDEILAAGERVADEVEVYFVEGIAGSAELKRSEVGEARESRSRGLGIRIIREGRIGASSTDDPARWRECLQAAVESGLLATPQNWEGLPGPADVGREVPIYDPLVVPTAEKARDLLSGLLEGASEHPVEIIGGSAGLSVAVKTLANTHDVRYRLEKTGVGVSLETIHGTSTGYEFDRSCHLDVDPVDVGRKAAFLAAHSAEGKDIKSGAYDVILSPIALSQLIGHILIPALSGRNVHVGRSVLADRLGDLCMDEKLNLYDDPFTRGLGSTPWDAEGIPTKRLEFVSHGVLRCFAYDLKTAYRYDRESTGSAVRGGAGGLPSIGVHNLIVDGRRDVVDDEPAIYIHDLVGAHTANPISGDFSVELSNPSWMQGGTYLEPVRSAMLAGNLFRMLESIEAIGERSRIIGSVILPPTRFNKMQIIGK